jgi:hypothetical protein
MGNSVDAHCKNCGLDRSFLTGGGMNNFTTYAAWPISCRSCQSVEIANFESSPLKCLRVCPETSRGIT